MSLLPREAQNLLHSRFSCMLIPFSMFSLDYDEGKVKVKYSRRHKTYSTGFEINGCPVVPDNENYDGATKLC